VIEFLDRITPGMDTEIATNLQRIFKKQGMKFKMSTKVMSATPKGGGGATLVTEPVKGGDPETMMRISCCSRPAACPSRRAWASRMWA